MRSGRSSATPSSLRGEAAAVLRRLTDPQALDPGQAAAFDAEGNKRCAEGARSFGQLAIAMLLASAALSFVVQDPFAGHLLVIRALGATAIGAALWHLNRSPRYPHLAGLAMVLMVGASIEALAAYTGGPSSVQHDRLLLAILGASV